MGYFGGPNKALANPCFKRPNLVSNGREPVERERGEQRREEEEEEEEEDGDQASQGMDAWIFGMETILIMELNGSMEL